MTEDVIDAAMGGSYEKIGYLIREAGYEDSSGYRRLIAAKIQGAEFAEVAQLLNVSEEQIRREFQVSESAPRVVDKRRFTKLDIEEERPNPSVDMTPLDDMGADLPVPGGPGLKEQLGEQFNADKWRLLQKFSPSSQPSTSPGMDFPTALKQVIKGQRVTRLEWENPDIWLMMFYWGQINPKVPAGKYLSIHHADGVVSPLYIGDGDLLADDWIVVV